MFAMVLNASNEKWKIKKTNFVEISFSLVDLFVISMALHLLTFSSESDQNRKTEVAGTPVENARTGSLWKVYSS
jgi:hypothetical protein